MNAPIAEFSNYDELRRALNAWREKRNLALEDLDDLAGLPDRYSAKIFGPRPAKRIGMQSLGEIIGALGLKGVFVEDAEAWERISKQLRFKTRDPAHLASVLNGAVHVQINRGFLRKIGAKGGANSRKNLGKRMVRKLAKQAAQARWGKVKRKSREQARRSRQRKQAHKDRKQNR